MSLNFTWKYTGKKRAARAASSKHENGGERSHTIVHSVLQQMMLCWVGCREYQCTGTE